MTAQKLVETSKSGLIIGHAELGHRHGKVEPVKEAVHGGDIITVHALGNIAIRLLGVDTPEVSFSLPGDTGGFAFKPLDSREWKKFLCDPFAAWPEGPDALGEELVEHLLYRLGDDTAANHARHAEAAHRALEVEVQHDIDEYADGDAGEFRVFLRYARDIVDRYGRLLAYANVDLPDSGDARPLTYNERMLIAGLAVPYFIWPNLDPFKQQARLMDAVPEPGTVRIVAETGSLGRARQWVRQARHEDRGVFDTDDPLLLYPFELRFLASRRAPDRWVIDLGSNEPWLLRPEDYCIIPDLEDRLFVPEEHLRLFEARGWLRA